MYIHAGKRRIVSDKKIIGIFNIETLKMSRENKRFFDMINPEDRTIFVDRKNNFITSNVSSYTIMSRTAIDCNFVWRRKDE